MSRYIAEKLLSNLTSAALKLTESDVENIRHIAREYLNLQARNESLQRDLTLQHMRADIAKHALQGIIANSRNRTTRYDATEEAKAAVLYADALIAALQVKP